MLFVEAFLFIVGLAMGSFLNVVILRYKEDKNVFNISYLSGRSHCPHCKSQLRWYELLPIFSFIYQKGKCNHCGKKISWQYPLIELATGFIFLLPLAISHIPLAISVLWVLAFVIFLLIWAIDYRLYLIPDELNISLFILAVVKIILDQRFKLFGNFQGSFMGGYADIFGLRHNIWINHLSAAAIGAIIIVFFILISRGRGMGLGDLKLMFVLGLLFGWPDIVLIFMLGSLVGALVSVPLLVLRKKGMKDLLPFAPFLIIGSILIFFFGEMILRGYFNLFTI